MHLTDEQLETLRKKLSERGREVNEKIVALQAGKTILSDSAEASFGGPTDDRLTRLRLFLTAIQSKMKAIRSGDEYGVCKQCKKPFDYRDLESEPWKDRCYDCPEAD